MKHILPLLPRPSQYLGIEEGSITCALSPDDLHCVLAFPDMYEVGMSYLGHKILYALLNNTNGLRAERVFAPSLAAAEILREHDVSLASLETDTELAKSHLLGFAITHELCYTNVLYMLDLAGIPFRAEQRGDNLFEWPLVVAGGGCTLSAEPLAPFMDAMLLGEGEDLALEFAELLQKSRKEGLSKKAFLEKAALIHGVYVPSFFDKGEKDGPLLPLKSEMPKPKRRIVADFDEAAYPIQQIVPFGAIHNRLSLEIARGCTRGCRFCQAGMLYRPARERSLEPLHNLLDECLAKTGFDEVSFLSLSTGDFSAIKTLFLTSKDRCAAEQISVSLPSLRVGSIDEDIMAAVASIRRTGATLAPEAGSQALRDVINKGITEEALLEHVRSLVMNGWQQVKLYFMIGLPHETEEDLEAIVTLARKVRDEARKLQGKGGRFQVGVAISPFVPKAHTPFQRDAQISLELMKERIHNLRTAIKKEKNITMRWHEPALSQLEGIFSRAGRDLSFVLEEAYARGAIFPSWMEHFSMEPWEEAFAACGIEISSYSTSDWPEDKALPWDHLESGIDPDFLKRERQKAKDRLLSSDCRYEQCHACGVCDLSVKPSRLHSDKMPSISTFLNFAQRDQEEYSKALIEEKAQEQREIFAKRLEEERCSPKKGPQELPETLVHREQRFRVWHHKKELAAYFSQLELQSILERSLRRAGIPMAFSQGFHPLPLLSFGRALPVSVESYAEWFSITLREKMTKEEFMHKLSPRLLPGLELTHVELVPIHQKSFGSVSETFSLQYLGKDHADFQKAVENFLACETFLFTRETKKGERTSDIRPLIAAFGQREVGFWHIECDWSAQYLSPLTLIRAIVPFAPLHCLKVAKLSQTH